MICQRLQGGSILDCDCMIENEGGWLECPPPLRRPLPKLDAVMANLPKPVKPVTLGWGSGRDMVTGAEFAAIVAEVMRSPSVANDLTFGGTTNGDPTPPGRFNVEFWRSPKPPRETEPTRSATRALEARAAGFTGELCASCGGANMVRSGTCSTCVDCGSTSGCS